MNFLRFGYHLHNILDGGASLANYIFTPLGIDFRSFQDILISDKTIEPGPNLSNRASISNLYEGQREKGNSTAAIAILFGLPFPPSNVKLFTLCVSVLWIVSLIGLRTGFCSKAARTFSQVRSSGVMAASFFVVTAMIKQSS